MTEEKKVFDLDELFGQARAVKVKYGNREYELLRMEALSPRAISKFQGMQKRSNQLQMIAANEEEITEEQDAEIVSLFNEMLRTLCQDLPVEGMPFALKAKVLEYYIQETQPKNPLNATLEN